MQSKSETDLRSFSSFNVNIIARRTGLGKIVTNGDHGYCLMLLYSLLVDLLSI